MTQIIRLELVVLNNNKYDSRVAQEGDRNTYGDLNLYSAHSFEEGLSNALLQAFDDMRNDLGIRIHRLKCSGFILPIKKEPPVLLSDVIGLNTEHMEILTVGGYATYSYFEEKMSNVSSALMLLVWKWSRHFTSDNMDGTNDFSSSMRACVVCGKVQNGVRTGQLTGGIHYKSEILHINSVLQRYVYPSEHCFNPKCYSHEIERMIDPAYVFVPPKQGEDLEADLARTLGEKVVKKDHPMGTGYTKVIKKNHDEDPAVKSFLKDMT